VRDGVAVVAVKVRGLLRAGRAVGPYQENIVKVNGYVPRAWQ